MLIPTARFDAMASLAIARTVPAKSVGGADKSSAVQSDKQIRIVLTIATNRVFLHLAESPATNAESAEQKIRPPQEHITTKSESTADFEPRRLHSSTARPIFTRRRWWGQRSTSLATLVICSNEFRGRHPSTALILIRGPSNESTARAKILAGFTAIRRDLPVTTSLRFAVATLTTDQTSWSTTYTSSSWTSPPEDGQGTTHQAWANRVCR